MDKQIILDAMVLRQAVQRVRELHKQVNGPADDLTCDACAVDEINYPTYPCPTIKALDGVS